MSKINYDEVSKVYDRVRVGDPVAMGRMLEVAQPKAQSAIIDIGCGTGNNTVLVANITGAAVTGFDQSEGMLDKAKEKNSNINFISGDAVYLSGVENEKYDIAFMTDVIHHIKDIDTMFKNIYRALKPDGYVFIFTDGHDQIKNNRLVSRYFPETVEVELKRYQSNEEILGAMKKNNFSYTEVEEISYPADSEAGEKLEKIAENKGYSMFHLISEESIERGLGKLRCDLSKGDVVYYPKTLMFIGRK